VQHQEAIADFTGSAVLQGACGNRLQRHALRLAASCLCGIYRSGNSTIALFKSLSNKINIKNKDQVSPVKSVSLLFFETPVKQKQ